ncbi:MAG: phosphoesterase [Desulfobacterales bacterium]|jgi:nanoRNase/pAp phosphatase (c-di-AMP/oligoRNAs hydrolase)|nr:phosphoesterase [Desulfobacteraceae bacterium]MBT4363018.1 phosphoesterase [Desulfobacteraceae bacterium]MBT7085521.1 phosphoesterase [Desulfobacterales bacterium]
MSHSAAQRLSKFYDRFSGSDQVLIMINADPDAIASAMAVKRLLWRKVAGVTICNINKIKRPDNLAMIRLLGVDLLYAGELDQKEYSRFVIVDSQPDHHECFAMFRPDVIIDHHPETCAVAGYLDIRPDYGAVASIMTEYLRAAKIKPSIKLATGLFHAIKTDTGNFERQTLIEDIRAFQYLYRFINIHLAQKIERSEISIDFLKYYTKALKEKRIRRGRLYAHLGKVPNPDICVLVADFFMRVESLKWSFVSCIFDKTIVVVFRNDGIHKNAGRIAQKAFSSMGSAGGHKSMARAEVPLGAVDSKVDFGDDKRVLKWIINCIEKRL